MDYFAKFKKRIVPPKAPPTTAMQLARFHKCWDYVHNIFVVEDRKPNMHVQQTEIPERLREMMDMLVDEEARQEDNTTGVCMEYFLKNGVLQYLVNVSEKADYPVGIRGEAIRTIANMVDLLDDRFLVHNAVHKPTIKLLRFCVLDDRQNDIYHEDLVDLMYIICSKIHGFPALLNIFFHDKQWLTTPQKTTHTDINKRLSTSSERLTAPSSDKPEYEFLLFTYLLRFVHREGRAGDYARTGLLFLMEMANHQLGDFILESDFATIMAAGLGALYSQLPRKLIIKDESQINASQVSYLLGQDLDPRSMPSGMGVQISSSPDFKYQLDSFLKLFEFCQDVLMRCPNAEVSIRLLQSIRTIFLENILYPSILECSDLDGSSVAVTSYIDLILQTLQQDELSKLIVGFLMDEDDDVYGGSLNRVETESTSYFTASGERFTLKDLIFSRLTSTSQSTVIATLKLLRTLISRHCRYALKLLTVTPEERRAPDTSSPLIISHHIREIELYFSLISAVDGSHAEDILSSGYEAYLQDIEAFIDADSCYQCSQNARTPKTEQTSKSERRRSFKYGQRMEVLPAPTRDASAESHQQRHHLFVKHRIRPTDPLLQILLGLLSHFFAQSSELNMALTGVLSALAVCPFRSLEGWLGFSENDRTNPDDILILDDVQPPATQSSPDRIRPDDILAQFDNVKVDEDAEDDDRSVDYGAVRNSAKMTPRIQFKSFPPFFTLFRTLTKQVDYYRSEVDNFDELLEERRAGLMMHEMEKIPPPTNGLNGKTGDTSPAPGPRKPPATPAKSISSTTAAAVAAAAGSIMAPLQQPTIQPDSSQHANGTDNPNPILDNPLSPLAVHARTTQSTRIQPLFPSNFVSEQEEPIMDLDRDDEDTFAPKTSPSTRRLDKSTEITLSMLLNNVVILEEAIKELVAIMQVRRSLGIDQVQYL
ncbi:Retinoic acid induced 16-like protein-domain-containing protein [Syncephalastrum racemosum]|uniref:Retinoic acid induced 16-like protein-domain-containing protein n=1 Tax=Syncephalastrum racemosum TaxID=13706 RepID=A0A1X2HQU7_SYNRA|nr:Retinoic acid induced 16-like protein-domain-containing protein [Syncephalastrum racemosum]